MLYIRTLVNFFTFERVEKWKKYFKKVAMLARSLQSNFCSKLIEFIKKIVFSEEFLEKYRISSTDFTRTRTLTFTILFFFMINFRKGSYQDEADGFFKALDNEDSYARKVSGAAISKARRKIRPEAYIDLNRSTINFFYENTSHLTWNGFNLRAIDGTISKLPKAEEIMEHFGCMNTSDGVSVPMARISQMYDVQNKITIDAIISPKEIGERELASRHIINLMPMDLLLLDRGYPATWLFKLILSQDGNFCARVPYNTWKITQKFFRSGKYDKTVKIPLTPLSIRKCLEIGLNVSTMKLRMIRVDLEDGKGEVLITSLLDKIKYPTEIFGDLYANRWPVEEDFKTLKRRFEIERFSGLTVTSIYQDFHAKIFGKNVTAILAYSVKDEIQNRYKNRKYPYQINFVQAVSKMKDTIVLLFLRTSDVSKHIISGLREIFILTVEAVRNGRKFPRKHKIGGKEFYPNYKHIR